MKAETGSFFGDDKTRSLGIKHFMLNVVDTPGWGDTDPGKRAINSQRIAQSLRNVRFK